MATDEEWEHVCRHKMDAVRGVLHSHEVVGRRAIVQVSESYPRSIHYNKCLDYGFTAKSVEELDGRRVPGVVVHRCHCRMS